MVSNNKIALQKAAMTGDDDIQRFIDRCEHMNKHNFYIRFTVSVLICRMKRG